jgi:hypothetical protein
MSAISLLRFRCATGARLMHVGAPEVRFGSGTDAALLHPWCALGVLHKQEM